MSSPRGGDTALLSRLPSGWTTHAPGASDVGDLHALLVDHETAVRGASSAARADVEADITGPGRHTRRSVLVRDGSRTARGWGAVHDRAAGRVVVTALVDPDLDPPTAETLAGALFAWAEEAARALGRGRGQRTTQLDSGAFADDPRQQRWLQDAGFAHVRTWWQMRRPVLAREGADGALPAPGAGVVVRRVAGADDGLPERQDLVTVHDVLETSFTDHFNYHEETFDEFCARLREDPGHRWDHWWIAELTPDGARHPAPAGALVGAVSPGSPEGSYVAYLGVLRLARGRGVARSLLHAVIADAAQRGRDRVSLEVDADSPTGAVELYASLGFVTTYVTQSWHRDLPVEP